MLAQANEQGDEIPIAYMSQKLNKAQQNYSVTERECLAAVLAIKKFRAYVEGQKFTVVTDHASLRWLMNQTDLSGRLARWALKFQAFDFTIQHRKGSANVVPDALSRINCEDEFVAAMGVDYVPDINLSSEAFDEPEYVELKKRLMEHPAKYPDFKISEKFIYHRTEFYSGDPLKENAA